MEISMRFFEPAAAVNLGVGSGEFKSSLTTEEEDPEYWQDGAAPPGDVPANKRRAGRSGSATPLPPGPSDSGNQAARQGGLAITGAKAFWRS